MVLSTVWPGFYPQPMPFDELSGYPVHTGRISCSIELLIEVLFSFPLRYLFAIGYHAFIFSLGWPAPPIFSQHYQADLLARRGFVRLLPPGRVERPVPRGISPYAVRFARVEPRPFDHISHTAVKPWGFSLGLFPVHSQLLGESRLISFPPLTDMLKFSG